MKVRLAARKAKPAEYQGRKVLLLDGGAAPLKDFAMRDGVIDVDVATPARRGFFGIQLRITGRAEPCVPSRLLSL